MACSTFEQKSGKEVKMTNCRACLEPQHCDCICQTCTQARSVKRNYKYTILRHVDGIYAVTGYEWIGGAWVQHGAVARWSYIGGALEHIAKLESELING